MERHRVVFPAAVAVATVVGAVLALVIADRDPGHTPTVLATAVVAFAVAWLTAFTTDRRQVQQLAHDERTLDLRLRHERDLNERSELLGALDDATRALTRAYHAFTDVGGTWAFQVGAEGTLTRDDLLKARDTMLMEEGRLGMRLGVEHPIPVLYGDAYNLVRDGVSLVLTRADTTGTLVERQQLVSDLANKLHQASGRWSQAVHQKLD
jgi:hypothetical protein